MTASAPDPHPRPLVPPRWSALVLGVLAVAFLGIGVQQARQDAPTVDEGVDVSSGVVGWVRHDLRLVPEHPPLAKAVAALPALLARPIVPDTAAYREGDWFDYSDDFIAANEDAGRLRPMLLWARSVVLLEAIACAALLYHLARRPFGRDGGFLVAAVWLTTPYVVGLAHFAMIDIPFTLVTLATCLLLARWRESPTPARAVALGAGLGAALTTRHTALVLVAVVVGVVAWEARRDRRNAVRQVAAVAATSLVVTWAVYRGLSPGGPSGAVAGTFDGLVGAASADSLLARLVLAVPMPAEWRAGFAHLSLTSGDRPSSLLGSSWDGGRWWFFPVSTVLKVPLPVVVAVVAGWLVALRGRGVGRRGLAVSVALPGVALWAFLVLQPLNLGLRLAIPVVALALVGVGGLARPAAGRPLVAGAVGALCLLQVAASAAAVPHSLAWMPPPFRPGYRWVSDSSIDAGQGLYEVRAWARDRDRPYVALDTTRGLTVGGGSRRLGDVDPTAVRGWVAVGVTPLMQTRRDELAWLRKYCPVGTLAGGSVLVYRFDRPPDPRPGPERPVSACEGADASTRRGG